MKTVSPIVSVVMAAFNEERYIHEAIDSILGQTFSGFEFIIINDGSIDKTEEIILSYNDPRIRYIKNERNIKLIASLNKGLKAATGKYIARMDADDICFPERLEKQVKFMEANPAIGISGSQLLVFGDEAGMMTYPLSHEEIKSGLLITSCFGNNVVIFRKDILQQYQLFFSEGYYHAEDYKCWTNWISVTKTANLNESLVKYRSHSGSVSARHQSLQRETRNRIRKEYLMQIFHLDKEAHLAVDFTGKLSYKRITAIKKILELNRSQNNFKEHDLKNTITKLWYLDALEEAEGGFSVLFCFPLVCIIDFKHNFVRWINVAKHFLKSGLKKK